MSSRQNPEIKSEAYPDSTDEYSLRHQLARHQDEEDNYWDSESQFYESRYASPEYKPYPSEKPTGIDAVGEWVKLFAVVGFVAVLAYSAHSDNKYQLQVATEEQEIYDKVTQQYKPVQDFSMSENSPIFTFKTAKEGADETCTGSYTSGVNTGSKLHLGAIACEPETAAL